jgi:hypothetical protein
MQLSVQFVLNGRTELNKYGGQVQPEMLHVNGNFSVTKKESFSKPGIISCFKPENYETDRP